MFKRILSLVISMSMMAVLITGCTSGASNDANINTNIEQPQKLSVVTTLFPQYDFTREIVGDKVEVTLLLPAGTDSHSYEPTPSDIIKVNACNLFVYTGEYMENWAERFIDGMDNKGVVVLDVSKGISVDKPEHSHEHESEEHHEDKNIHDEHESEKHHDEHEGEEHHADEDTYDGHNHTYDPHIWTDPNNAKIMMDNILNELCQLDPENAEYFKTNANNYKRQLDDLDKEMKEIISNGSRKEIVHGGRNAFYYFSKQYGLDVHAAYDSCSTETEPSAKVVAELIDDIKAEKIPVIFYEELSTPKVAQTISNETGAKMLLLHSCHNVSKEELKNGATYLSLMKQNAENLKEALK